MPDEPVAKPDSTAVRTALWRALHVEIDPPPHVFEDVIGLKLVGPEEDWRRRPDMSPFTKPFRASIVARARFVEDLVEEAAARGVGQYVILGAGLDTFAQRRPELASRMTVFEVDRPGPQEWKRRRLEELGFGVPEYLRFVPVDFESDGWWERVRGVEGGGRPARSRRNAGVPPATGVDARPIDRTGGLRAGSSASGRDARSRRNAGVPPATGVDVRPIDRTGGLRHVAGLAPGSTLAMTFMLPIELVDPEVRAGVERAAQGARASGTPFISFFTPEEMLTLAREAGFRDVRHVSAAMLGERYFAGRTDGLRPPLNSEEFLVATN